MTQPAAPPSNPPSPAVASPEIRSQPVLESDALFQGAKEVVIRHGGREYRLRRTRLGKLILTA